MINININTEQIEQLISEQISNQLIKIKFNQKLFYTIKDLIEITGLSEGSLYKYLLNEPGLNKYKVGNKWLFKKEETNLFLNEWIEKHQI